MRAVGPAPLLAQLTEARVDEHRYLRCRRYDACLARAARGDWASWTCTQCLHFHPRRRWSEARRWRPTPEAPAEAGGALSPAREPERPALRVRADRALPSAGPVESRTSHSVEARAGQRVISVLAPSVPELFVEAGRAAAEVVRGLSEEVAGDWNEEVAIAAPDREALLGEWVRQLVLRSEQAGARFSEHDIVYLSEDRLVAMVRGSRVARVRGPSEGVTYREPSIHPRADGVQASVVLQV